MIDFQNVWVEPGSTRISHHKPFGSEKYGFDKPVLENVNLSVEKGKLLALIGPSGSGKSVLLKAACGLLSISRGKIEIANRTIQNLKERDLFSIRSQIGMLFQQGALFDTLSVLDNVAFPLRRSGVPEKETKKRALLEIDRVGLKHAANLLPSQLSGGMRKRVGIARALVINPIVAFYDEPTAGLDPVSGARILQLLRKACDERGVAAIAVGHEIDTILPSCDEVAMLLNGRIIYQGTTDGINDLQHFSVRQFLTGSL